MKKFEIVFYFVGLVMLDSYLGEMVFPCGDKLEGCERCVKVNKLNQDFYECTECMSGLFLFQNSTQSGLKTTVCVEECSTLSLTHTNDISTSKCRSCGNHCQRCHPLHGCLQCHPSHANSKLSVLTSHPLNTFSTNPKFKICTSCQGLVKFKNSFPCKTCEIQAGTPVCLSTLDQYSNLTETHDYIDKGQNSRLNNCKVVPKDIQNSKCTLCHYPWTTSIGSKQCTVKCLDINNCSRCGYDQNQLQVQCNICVDGYEIQTQLKSQCVACQNMSQMINPTCAQCANGKCTKCMDGYQETTLAGGEVKCDLLVVTGCHADCGTCFGGGIGQCLSCGDGKYLDGSTCKGKTNAPQILDIFVAPFNSSGLELEDGSLTRPFSDLPRAIEYAHTKAAPFTSFTINIWLQKGTHFILPNQLNFYHPQVSTSTHDHAGLKLGIQPLVCGSNVGGQQITSKCSNPNETVKIVNKIGGHLRFKIGGELSIKNVEIDAVDTQLNVGDRCRWEKRECCQFGTQVSAVGGEKCEVPYNGTHPNCQVIQSYISMFIFRYTQSTTSSNPGKLILNGVSLSHFFYRFNSFILTSYNVGQVSITNSFVTKMGTCASIINNIMPQFPSIHSQEGVSISGKEASILQLRAVRARYLDWYQAYPWKGIEGCNPKHSPCTFVNIYNLTVDQYFIGLPTLTTLSKTNTNHRGQIINLNYFPGYTQIKNSVFKNSQLKLASCSTYQIYVQLIFVSQIFNQFICIKNTHAPVEIISNKFERNSGYSGQFMDISKLEGPIVVKGNQFFQNSGGMRSNLIQIDDKSSCGGLVFEGNNFTQNIRCPYDDETQFGGSHLWGMACKKDKDVNPTSEVKVSQNGIQYDPTKVLVRSNVYIENFYSIRPLIMLTGFPTIELKSETFTSNVGNVFLQAADMYSPLKSTVGEYTKHFKPWGIGQTQTYSIMVQIISIPKGTIDGITINDPQDLAIMNQTKGKQTIFYSIQFPTKSVWNINNITISSLSGASLTSIKKYTTENVYTFPFYHFFQVGSQTIMKGYLGKVFEFDLVDYTSQCHIDTYTINNIDVQLRVKLVFSIPYDFINSKKTFKNFTLTNYHIKNANIAKSDTLLMVIKQQTAQSSYTFTNIMFEGIGTRYSRSKAILIRYYTAKVEGQGIPQARFINLTSRNNYIDGAGAFYIGANIDKKQVSSSQLTIDQSSFLNLYTLAGMIYFQAGYSMMNFTLSNSKFNNITNINRNYAGGLDLANIHDEVASYLLINNTFTNFNVFGSNNGALFISTAKLTQYNKFTIINTHFDCQEKHKTRDIINQQFKLASFNPNPTYYATLYFSNSNVHMLNVKIENCQNMQFAAIYSKWNLEAKNLTIMNCTGYQSGGLYVNTVGNTTIDGLQIENVNGRWAGAFMMRFGDVIMTNSRFVNSYGEMSGALYSREKMKSKFTNCTFERNEGVQAGVFNLILQTENGTFIQDCVFKNNVAQKQAIIVLDKTYLDVKNCMFVGDKGVSGFGDVYLIQSNLYLYNTSFRQVGQEHQDLVGGFISVLLSSKLVVVKSKFEGGYFTKGGGLMMDGQSDAELVGCEVRDIRVSQVGGALYLSNVGMVTLKDTIFENCWNDKNILGGAFIFAQLKGKLVISNVSLAITKLKSNINFINLNQIDLDANQLNIDGSSNPEFTSKSDINLGGGLHLESMNSFKIQNSVIKGIHGTTIGGGIAFAYHSYDLNTNNTYQIINTNILNNKAQYGGGIYIQYATKLLLQNVQIQNNQAVNGHGGGDYYSSIKASLPISIKFTGNSSITSNIANGTGGGIKWNYYPINQLPTTITNNTATIYGNNQASYPNHIKLTSHRNLNQSLNQVQSGGILPTITGNVYDKLRQIIKSESSNQVTIKAVSTTNSTYNTILKGVTSVIFIQGQFQFKDLTFITQPGTSLTLQISTNTIDLSLPDNIGSGHNTFNQSVHVRQCVVGEQFKATGECQKCKVDDEYLIVVQSSTGTCKPCIREVMVCKGGSEIGPRPGYWRQSNLTDQFYQCLRPDACLGMASPQMNPVGECKPGFSGRLCAQCEDGYSSTGQFNCSKCPHLVWNILRMIGTLLLAIICIVLLIKTTIQSAQKRKKLSSIYLKILLNHFQLIFLCSTFEFNWPDNVRRFFSTQAPLANISTQFLSFDCFLQQIPAIANSSQFNIFFFKVSQYAILPIPLILLSIIFWKVKTMKLIGGIPKLMLPRTIATIIILMFLVHPSIVKIMFDSINCKKVEGKRYMVKHMEVQCYSSLHLRWVLICSIPSLVIWGVGIPQLGWYVLYWNRERLNKVDVKQKYGFLFNGYKRTTYYWESVIMYRKIMVIFISVILKQSGVIVQALCVALLLVVFLIITLQFRPFSVTDLNRIESLSIYSSLITVYCGLFYLSHRPQIYQSQSQEVQTADNGVRLTQGTLTILFLIIVLSNILFLLFWIYKFLTELIKSTMNTMPKLYLILCMFGNKHYLEEAQIKTKIHDESDELRGELEIIINKIYKAYDRKDLILNRNLIERLAVYLDINSIKSNI